MAAARAALLPGAASSHLRRPNARSPSRQSARREGASLPGYVSVRSARARTGARPPVAPGAGLEESGEAPLRWPLLLLPRRARAKESRVLRGRWRVGPTDSLKGVGTQGFFPLTFARVFVRREAGSGILPAWAARPRRSRDAGSPRGSGDRARRRRRRCRQAGGAGPHLRSRLRKR